MKLKIIVCPFLLTSGCLGLPGSSRNTYWELNMKGLTVGSDETRFVGEIGLSANYETVKIHDLRLRMVDSENRTLGRVHVGTLNSTRPAVAINETVSEEPAFVYIDVGTVESPDNMEYQISVGLKRTQSGDYVSV